ncbi:MAG: hypothetical protein IK065_02195 [Neisseriaceae bacterium]|nr:hypothetical protein [Neisseriaceae bacterium]
MINTQRIPNENTNSLPERLYDWCLVVDGNAHRDDLCRDKVGFQTAGMLSEALLPQIRTIACMIASQRHDFSKTSPDIFTEEADWFAARILVLEVRVFYLDVSLFAMLNLANSRAKEFATQHNLPFTPAKARMSINSGRPNNMLIMQRTRPLPQIIDNVLENSLTERFLCNITI